MLVPGFETPAPPHSKAHAPALSHPTSQFAGRMSPGPKGPVQGQSEEFSEIWGESLLPQVLRVWSPLYQQEKVTR